MKPTIPLLLVLLTLTLPQGMEQVESTRDSDLYLGYSPLKLFDTNLGTPVYIPGESLWAFTPSPHSFTLSDPSGKKVATKQVIDSPIMIHRFSNTDPEGVWVLSVRGSDLSVDLTIHFLKTRVETVSVEHNLSLSAGLINISGIITLVDQPEFPITIILGKREPKNYTLEPATNITIGSSNLRIKVNHDLESELIRLSPYLENPEDNITAIIWAELILDVPLVKTVNHTSSVITFVKESALKTKKLRIELGEETDQTLSMGLGKPSDLEFFPLRQGRMEILLNIQIGNTIHLVKIPFFLLPTINGLNIVGIQESSPSRAISFTFSDEPVYSQVYSLYLILQSYGVDILYDVPISPPLARIYLHNELLDRIETDFELIPKGETQISKAKDFFYILVPKEEIVFDYEIMYGGIVLKDEDVSPRPLRLKPFHDLIIDMKAGYVTFSVKTKSNVKIVADSIVIHRIIDDHEEMVRTVTSGEVVNTTMPVGFYRATVTVAEESQTKSFNVNNSSTVIQFVFDDSIIQQTSYTIAEQTDMALITLALVIIGVEAFIAYRVWGRALGRR